MDVPALDVVEALGLVVERLAPHVPHVAEHDVAHREAQIAELLAAVVFPLPLETDAVDVRLSGEHGPIRPFAVVPRGAGVGPATTPEGAVLVTSTGFSWLWMAWLGVSEVETARIYYGTASARVWQGARRANSSPI